MEACKRALAALTLLVSAAVLLGSLAAGIGVWIVRAPVAATATRVFDRIENALDLADQGLAHVNTSLTTAGERLESAKAEQEKLAQEPRKKNAMARMLARTVQQRIAPEVGSAQQKLHTVAEAVVVVNSMLEDVGNLPFLSVAGLDVDRLTEMNGRLADVGPAAWELSRLLGEPDSDADAASTQLSRIERTLQTLRGWIGESEVQMTQVRQRTEALKSRALFWITPAAVVISLVCFWIALSQVSLMAHAWSWWKRLDAGSGVQSSRSA